MKLKRIRNWSAGICVASATIIYAATEFEHWWRSFRSYDFVDGIIMGLFLFPLFIFIATLLMNRKKEAVFDSWWKFTRVYIPLSFFLILITPGGPSSGLINIDSELVTWWLSGIFLFVSIVLIMVKSRKLRSKGS